MDLQYRLRRTRAQLVKDTRTSNSYLLGFLFCRKKSKFAKLKLKTPQEKLTPVMPLNKQIGQEKSILVRRKSYDPNNMLLLGRLNLTLQRCTAIFVTVSGNSLRLDTCNLTTQFPFV
jgi:hypothetical protein